jgi:hypothetical protein
MINGYLETTIAFYNPEVTLWRGSRLSFFRMMMITAKNSLRTKGAFGPFAFKIERADGNLSPHVLHVWERY